MTATMVRKPNVFLAAAVSALAVVALSRTTPVDGVRILAVSTIAGKSHWNFMSAVLRSLTDAGHRVTVFTQFPDGDRENYTEVDTSGEFPMKLEIDIMHMLTFRRPDVLLRAQTPVIREHCDMVYGNDRLADIMRSGGRVDFDAIVVEPLGADCMSHLAGVLDLPMIYVIPSPMITHVERAHTGHVSNPASVSHLLSRQSVPGTFVQRFANAALLAYSVSVTGFRIWTMKLTDPKPYDDGPAVSPSIIFQNTHYVTEASRPEPPNVIELGGIHLKPPKTIPRNILDFIEDAPHGVIYFTFGSVVKFSSLSEQIKDAFKQALAQVPQKVLWKYEGEMKDKPRNVMIQKWFPQREILLHPSVKLFISHGGISGVYEAVDASVPVLGFPLLYDQPRNMEHLVRNGMAISMDLFTVTKESLLNSILELINNEKYIQNAKMNSVRFKDRPMTPEQSVVYWTEYVVRHKGASHLKLYSLNLPGHQYLLLDVISVMLIYIAVVLFIVYKGFKYICMCTANNSQN